jgi:hypothetical protein
LPGPSATEEPLSDPHVRALARAILERPRYKNFQPWRYDPWPWLSDLWRAAMSWIEHLHTQNRTLYWVLLIALCALCGLMFVHIAATLREALRTRPPTPRAEAVVGKLDFARDARALASAGRHLEAAHYLLLASLRVLAEGRHIPLHPEDGNRAVCRQLIVSELPATLRNQLIELILETEQAWFGGTAIVADSVEHVGPTLYRRWAEVSTLLSQVAPR